MGRRPNLKSEAFSISTILCVEIIANLCLKPLKKVLHYSGARPRNARAYLGQLIPNYHSACSPVFRMPLRIHVGDENCEPWGLFQMSKVQM